MTLLINLYKLLDKIPNFQCQECGLYSEDVRAVADRLSSATSELALLQKDWERYSGECEREIASLKSDLECNQELYCSEMQAHKYDLDRLNYLVRERDDLQKYAEMTHGSIKSLQDQLCKCQEICDKYRETLELFADYGKRVYGDTYYAQDISAIARNAIDWADKRENQPPSTTNLQIS